MLKPDISDQIFLQTDPVIKIPVGGGKVIITVSVRQRQEDYGFEASFGYTATLIRVG